LDIETIESIAKRYDVKIAYSDNLDKSTNWRTEPFELKGLQKIKSNFVICHEGNNCIQLRDGKLFPCPQAAYIRYFNLFFNKNLEITERDYISIYSSHTIQEILQFLAKPIPFCRYCLIGDNLKQRTHQQWRISKKDISEWT
jgi:hypothetical protein